VKILLPTITLCWLMGAPALAQGQQRIFKPDEMVETGGGYIYKIIQCKGAGANEECVVDVYRDNALTNRNFTVDASDIRAGEQRVLAAKGRQAQALVGNENTNRTAATTVDCSFIAPSGDTAKTAKPSEQLFKRKIYDLYNLSANGTGSAPLRVGVVFLSFQSGNSFTNTVRVDPVRGALRINDAAPVNAIIYPVKSKHIVCEQYRDSTIRKQVENKYACFKDRDGAWLCGGDGIPKITQLH
jgi:hypothetical protein